ncbi:signal peptidase I [Curtobacterium sp. MCPF17_050]|uniref:signal peptidase I n=1 Tax=Curtobacterium sp. MCPF17_050 TaxID=2175664 RepID=UPI000D8C3878|nr:signal peptidase I [Curtobacterium sp. MCPF17_050]WIB15791.1 signal peptidase I [Curtobacterium sp. MCPF17_050]
MRSSSWLRFTVVLAARGVIAALVGVAFWGIAPLALGWHTTTVMTGSMQPTLLPGDVVVSKPVPAHDLRAGQVLLFPDPDHAGVLRLHRLHDVDARGELVTKGDANPEADSTAVTRSSVVGVGYLRVPLVGLPVVWAAEHRTVPLVALAAGIVVLAGFAVVPAVRTRTDDPTDRLPHHGRHRAARPRRPRARAVVVAATVCAVVGVALPAPAAAAAFAATTTTGASSITTAVATPVTGLTCTNVGNAAVDVAWTYSGVAPERFTVLVDGAASGISTGAGERDVTLGASDFFVWKTSTISVRTDLTDTWTATSPSTVRITTIRLFGLGRTSCAR